MHSFPIKNYYNQDLNVDFQLPVITVLFTSPFNLYLSSNFHPVLFAFYSRFVILIPINKYKKPIKTELSLAFDIFLI